MLLAEGEKFAKGGVVAQGEAAICTFKPEQAARAPKTMMNAPGLPPAAHVLLSNGDLRRLRFFFSKWFSE